jgi:hypothetical protein
LRSALSAAAEVESFIGKMKVEIDAAFEFIKVE